MQLEDRMLLAGFSSPVGHGYTPAQITTAYGINAISLAVDHRSVIGNGAGQTIAIVDAGDDPSFVDSTAPNFQTSDLAMFDQHFGLPDPPSFTKVVLPNTTTANLASNETALDVEWAHAIAPGASIVLVEIPSLSDANLDAGVTFAKNLPGVSVVSMSIYGSEGMNDLNPAVASVFTTPPGHPNVTFVACTGDTKPGQAGNGGYPAFSPNVLAVGGTSLYLSSSEGYGSEATWGWGSSPQGASAGGFSQYQTRPGYQDGVQPYQATNPYEATNPNPRMTPDVAFDANPTTGVAIYNSTGNGAATPWSQEGGTSLGAPAWSAMIAIADQLRSSVNEAPLSSSQTLTTLYSLPADAFHKITTGLPNGNPNVATAYHYYPGGNYNLVTGLGSPVANVLVPALAGAPVLASLQREGIHHQTAIDLSFFGPLDPGPAKHLDNYKLLVEGPHGLFNHQIRLRSATSTTSVTQTVVLVPKHLSLNHTYELLVRGTKPHGLKGANGIFLAGGNREVIFSGFTPSSPVT